MDADFEQEPLPPAESFLVEQSLPLERLDVYLKGRLPKVSRGILQRLIESGHIRVDDTVVKPTHAPRAGELVEIHWPAPVACRSEPEDIPLEILFEDEHLVVINKSAGLVVHPAAGHHGGTLVNALLHHCHGQLSGIGGVARPGIVHRLDMDTSGCLIAAKTNEAHLNLAAQFEERTTEKTYRAIVCGEVAKAAGEIKMNIARHPIHRKRMAATTGPGREAWTGYRVIERLRHSTLIEARLHTGRTHQIRVHFQHLGHPVVGDTLYAARHLKRLASQTGHAAPRQMLHAWKLVFTHPLTGQRLVCEAPFPADFAASLQALRPPPPA